MSSLNPLFDYNITDFLTVTDGIKGTEEEMALLQHVGGLFLKANFSHIGNENYSIESIRQSHLQSGKEDRIEFERTFDEVRGTIDLDMLVRYAKDENPDLHKRLSADTDMLREDPEVLRELLWDEYQKRFRATDSMHFEVWKAITTEETKAHPNAHIVMLLVNHNIMASLHSQGSFNYHCVGRGFYVYGMASHLPLDGRSKPYPYCLVFNIHAVSNMDVDSQKYFLTEAFYHEFVGHVMGGLSDHHSIEGGNCVMTTRYGLNDVVRASKSRSGNYFCDSCSKTLGLGKQ